MSVVASKQTQQVTETHEHDARKDSPLHERDDEYWFEDEEREAAAKKLAAKLQEVLPI